MKCFLVCAVAIFFSLSCTDRRKDAPTSELKAVADSSEVVSDSVVAQSDSMLPPKSADELFDDFIYSFMTNRRFQFQRVKFPLPQTINGKASAIAAGAWHFDRIYSRRQSYTVIYDRQSSMKLEKSTKLSRVVVEWIYLTKRRVKQYVFERQNGEWYLTALHVQPMGRNVNADFLSFYQRFSTDSLFQRNHVASPVSFITYDSDSFQTVEGVIDVDQWFAFKPELPHGVITNINYGQSYSDSDTRIIVINGLSSSMYSVLTFQKRRGVWNLTKLQN